ncbi:DUF6383 domain-containing protein [uncultured Parabacteroides sp.]|uniref:DUF6383 domain-containing protein n=1 Tax=uncultured Parabacteroides sp. TaxID=512312 RepID=UPI00259B8E43|nr:DUF6383 domain-containing protein [uncultured Parabacteroides sp.]
MNKKFSTLVASLLFASAFSAYAGTAASTLAVPTAIETRAVVGTDKALEWNDNNTNALPAEAGMAAVKGGILPGFTQNARLLVIQNENKTTALKVADDKYVIVAANGAVSLGGTTATSGAGAYWTMQSDGELRNNIDKTLTVAGFGNFDVVPVKAKDKPGYFFVLRVKKSDGSFGGYVKCTDGTALTVSAGASATAELEEAALFVSVETEFAATATTGDKLNENLKKGFELSISSAKEGVVVNGADVFAGKLTAMEYASDMGDGQPGFKEATGGATTYFLRNEDGKYIYWDKDANKDSDKPGAFKLASAADALATTNTNNAYKFAIHAADNGSEAVQVLVNTDHRLYINNTNNEGRLTAFDKNDATVKAANWAVTSLGSSNEVDLTQFLTGQFVKVNYVTNGKENTTNTYKIGGILTVAADGASDDFVNAKNFVAEDPATQWAVTTEDRGTTIKLTNRENPSVSVTLTKLRGTNKTGVYEVAATAGKMVTDELITITPVTTVTMTDGYMVENANVLRNTAYYLAQSRQNADQDIPAYWAENHNASHQIGATVNKDFATKWNLAFQVKGGDKGWKNDIDSVLVVSTLHKWDATAKDVVETKSTLAILPYTFQNRENNEFVKNYGYDNLKYYICDKDNNNAADNSAAQKFALKKKPGNTYNYVTLDNAGTVNDGAKTGGNTYDDNGYIKLTSDKSIFALGSSKLFLGNSLENGSWEEMAMYAKDNNSLMLVQPADDPEYHKIAAVWGDTISLHRADHESQKLYEKGDIKSIVDNDTLSFLNIDNVYEFTKMAPAIFADTAYVNRGEGDDANTCYQYLLAVEPSFGYHSDNCNVPGHPQGAGVIDTVYGRFLVNLIDTANIYGKTHLHNNPYINKNEAGESRAKLSFVEGRHVLSEQKLYIVGKDNKETAFDLNSPAFNVVKFAFRYVDHEAETFKIQTEWKEYNTAKAADKLDVSQEGYLKWINGTVVVENGYANGDVFGIKEGFEGNPTANESIESASTISVVATNGAVIVKGAEGKNVVITNVLGQQIANTVVSSSEATISAPAGVVVVAVEGEAAVKAIVK